MGDHNATMTYNDYLNTIRGKPIMSIIITFDNDNLECYEWRGNDQVLKDNEIKCKAFIGLVPNLVTNFIGDSLRQINIPEDEKLRLIKKGKEYLEVQHGR